MAKVKVALINPNLMVQQSDPFTTGIVYMPIGLAYISAALRQSGRCVQVIDAFGEAPRQAILSTGFMTLGLSPNEVVANVHSDVAIICIFANQLANHRAIADILERVNSAFPDIPTIILENTQAVTAYGLRAVSQAFFQSGARYLVCGEGERRLLRLLSTLEEGGGQDALKQIDGICWEGWDHPPAEIIRDLEMLEFPCWDDFPLESYWSLGFAHGPQTRRRYLPILTSRGCPYPCKFCVVPFTNARTWRARSAENVVDELEYLSAKWGVREFHWEDLNPTINDRRTREICNEIIRRNLSIDWKIVAGTKVETIRNAESVELMAKSGCTYLSISPESGSPNVLSLIDKPFDMDHAKSIVRAARLHGIRTQACFVLGFPGENSGDLALTREAVFGLVDTGVDEIALFIVSPVPGSDIYKDFSGFGNLSELTFTPKWRIDYQELNRFRVRLYREFLLRKIRRFPIRVFSQCFNFLVGRFRTKMEMVPYKALVYRRMIWRSKFFQLLGIR